MANEFRFALVAAVLVLGACSGGADSGESSTTTTAPTTPTTSTPAATTTVPATSTTSIPKAMLAQISNDAVRDIPYAEGSPKQVLDVYLPTTGDGPYPTILGIHGGQFKYNSKALYSTLGPYFAANGYAFVAISYRLTTTDSYPAQVEDSFCALAWLHANADEYGFDPDRVVVTGGSSGGYLAAMVGTVDDTDLYLEDCPNASPADETPQAVVIYYGHYDFTTMDDYNPGDQIGWLREFWGADYEDIPVERLAEMSATEQIDGSEPPFIILHGTADASISIVMSERLAAALERAGVDVELVRVPDARHAFERKPLTGGEMTLALSEIDDFLNRVLAP